VRARELTAMAIVSVVPAAAAAALHRVVPSTRASAWMTEPGSRPVGTFLPVASREPRRPGSALFAEVHSPSRHRRCSVRAPATGCSGVP
jgi:hypothetical protein